MLTGLLPASAATGSLRDQVEPRLAVEFPAIEAVYRRPARASELSFQEVRLELTVRSFDDAVARHLLDSIQRVSENRARAAGMPEDRLPVISMAKARLPIACNDPTLTNRLADTFREWFGADRVSEARPNTGGEDFAHYGRTTPRIPISIWAVGCSDPAVIAEAVRLGKPLPTNHTPYFIPHIEPTLRAGVASTCAAVLNLLGK